MQTKNVRSAFLCSCHSVKWTCLCTLISKRLCLARAFSPIRFSFPLDRLKTSCFVVLLVILFIYFLHWGELILFSLSLVCDAIRIHFTAWLILSSNSVHIIYACVMLFCVVIVVFHFIQVLIGRFLFRVAAFTVLFPLYCSSSSLLFCMLLLLLVIVVYHFFPLHSNRENVWEWALLIEGTVRANTEPSKQSAKISIV